ncbi:MAG: oxygen-independent coproporphyrinogen III oxidase [Clostridia bacterium]|nr:oxygen-independent coproporphyrinogen III oxidase [Clostridia bacterium]
MRGLYIHIPFCIKKCEYCDFISYTDCYDKEKLYLAAMVEEFKQYEDKQVDTVYIGGGTPSSLSTEGLIFLMDKIFEYFDVTEDAEITMEVNPKTADMQKLKALRLSGVNRLSIGVQSFCDDELNRIGRIHTAKDAQNCILDAKFAGFKNISVDLMFGLPKQTVESYRNSLIAAVAAGVNHISAYSLILEEGTPLYDKVQNWEMRLPTEAVEAAMYDTTCEVLRASGFYQYEVSNFSKTGYESRHNLKYWECEEYIGCGAAAHSYLRGTRFSNHKTIDEYIANPKERLDKTELTPKEQMSEFMFLGLRKTAGVDLQEFECRFINSAYEVYGEAIDKYIKLGLLVHEKGFLRFTERGMRLSNTVLCEFV